MEIEMIHRYALSKYQQRSNFQLTADICISIILFIEWGIIRFDKIFIINYINIKIEATCYKVINSYCRKSFKIYIICAPNLEKIEKNGKRRKLSNYFVRNIKDFLLKRRLL